MSTDPAHTATEHVHTPIWGRIQYSLGTEPLAKQTLTVFRNQCLQAQSISIPCIHMAWENHITGLQKLVLRERLGSLLRSTKHTFRPQARGTKSLQKLLLSNTKCVCMLGSARVYSICQSAAISRKWTHTVQSRKRGRQSVPGGVKLSTSISTHMLH